MLMNCTCCSSFLDFQIFIFTVCRIKLHTIFRTHLRVQRFLFGPLVHKFHILDNISYWSSLNFKFSCVKRSSISVAWLNIWVLMVWLRNGVYTLITLRLFEISSHFIVFGLFFMTMLKRVTVQFCAEVTSTVFISQVYQINIFFQICVWFFILYRFEWGVCVLSVHLVLWTTNSQWQNTARWQVDIIVISDMDANL